MNDECMADEERGASMKGNGNGQHVKVSIGVSFLVSVAAALLTWGVTWGVYSQRLATTEALLQSARSDLTGQAALNNAQEAKIAVLGSQYQEIIRRLEALDRKLEKI